MKVKGTPKDTEHELNERDKELNCLYQVTDLLNQAEVKLDEIIEKILYLIQSAIEFPNLASVVIKVNDKEYTTQNFKKTDWNISKMVVEGENDLTIEVYYREDRHFASEKIGLIEEVAFRLKSFIIQKNNKEQLEILKNVQFELEDSERKFRFLYENAPLAYQSLDYKGNILDVNDAWLKFMGYTKNEVIGKWFGDFIDPEYMKVLHTRFPKFKEEGEVKEIEYEVIKKDGIHAIVSFNGKIGYDENMNFERTHCIFHDITENKKMEQKLKESEEMFRNITEQSLMGIAIIQDDVIKYATGKLAEIYGYSVEEMLDFEPNGFLKLIDPEFLEIVKEQATKKQLGQKEIITNYEVRCVKKTGEKFWVENFSKTISYEGKPADLVTNIDITERKEAEQKLKNSEEKLRVLNNQLEQKVIERTRELKESEKKYKELFNHMTSGVAVYDVLDDATDFIIKDVNKAGEKIDNISKEEIIDKKVTEAFPSVKAIGLFDVFKRVWKTGIPEDHPISLYKDDRVSHWVENYVYKLPTGEIVAVYDNVTEKKIAELRLKESEEKFRSIFMNSPIGIELYDSAGKLVDLNRACLDMFGAIDVNSVKGFDLFQDPNVSEDVKMKLHSGEIIRYESEFDFGKVKEFNLYETLKSGIIDLDISITPLYQSGTNSISNYLVQVQDITERKKAEEEIRKRSREYSALLEASRAVLKNEDFASSSRAIFNACTELLGAPAGYIALLTPDKEENQIVFLNPGGYICTVDSNLPMPIRGMRSEVVKSKKALFNNKFPETDWLQFLPHGHVNLESVMFIPLIIDDDVQGLMGMANKPGGFTEEDINTASAFAEFVSIALQNSQALEALGKSEQRYKNLSNELEQKVIERTEELIESEKKYRHLADELEAIIDHIPGVVVYKDTQNNILRVNRFTAEAHNLQKEEMEGKSSFEIYPHEEAQAYWEDDLEVITSKTPKLNIVEPWKTLEGKRWVNTSKIPYIDKEGDVKGIIAIAMDITDEKIAEEKITEQNEFLANIIESLTHPFYVINTEDYTIEMANSASQFDVLTEHMKCYELTHRSSSPCQKEHPCPIEIVKNTKKPVTLEHIHYDKDGNARNIEIHGYPIIDQEGNVIQLIEYSLDITDRKKSEKELIEIKEFYKNVLDGFINGVWVTDRDDIINYTNKGMEKIAGVSAENIVGANVLKDFPESTLIHFKPLYLKAKNSLNPVYYEELPVTTPAGRESFQSGWLIPRIKGGTYDGMICTVDDVTERRRTELKLKESEEKFSKAFHSSPTLMAITRIEDGFFIDVNETYTQTLGYSREELIGRTSLNLNLWVKPEQRSEFTRRLKEQKRIEAFDVDVYTKSGKILTMLFSGDIIYLNNEPHLITIATDITDRIKAEQKLKESELRYRSLFENMTSAFAFHKIIVDENKKPIDYEFIEANYAFEEFTGLKVENIIGKTVKEVLPGIENDPADWIGKYGIVALTGIPMSFENHSASLDQWYSVSAYSPKKNYFAVTFTNITERKKIEKKIKESERKFRTIFEAIPDIFFLLTGDTTVLDYKAKIEDNLYIQPEEFIGKRLSEVLPGNLGQLALEKVSTTIKIKQPQILEYSLSIKDEIHFYEARFLYLSKDQVAALVRDITDRKKDEEDLLIKDYALDSSINAIAISDLIGNLTFVNPSFLKMWGYASEDEVLGQKASSFWASEEKADQIIKDLKNKYNWSGELIGKKKNGSLFDALLSASLVMDKNNNPICMMATFIDITERKRAEQLIIEENRKLKELSEMKRDIITRVSHELKTPLTSVHGASFYLLNYHKEHMIKEVLEYVEIIHRGGSRLKNLVEDLIDISRLESGKMDLKKSIVDINEIIKDCLKDIDIFASHRNISMKMEIQDEMLIAADKIRIGQVISNILTNAIKNTPPYGEISVNLNESIDDISIQVKDTGVGITDEEQQLLFKKFGKIERYGKGMDVDTEGSGLGLFISKEIVELHNGSIFFESDGRNRGTTFTIVLPKTR